MTGTFHPGSDDLGGENRSKKEKKNLARIEPGLIPIEPVVSIGIHNMLHQQVDLGSVPLSWTDLLCNKRWTDCLWELEAKTRCIPRTAWRIGPILPFHNWQSIKDSTWVESVLDNLLAPAKTGAFFSLAAAIVVRWDKGMGRTRPPQLCTQDITARWSRVAMRPRIRDGWI